ncbi:MAG: S-layer homology domain-containing protein [Lachnospiraceae bacterium]|nr:S-layer homology domain-containing protein [Lachnospiraceae bacterium]
MKKRIKRLICLFLSLFMVVGIINFRSLTASADGNVVNIFDDVEAGKWYVNAIQFVYDRGIMVGTSANTFGVHQKLQREQFAQILYSMAGKPFLKRGIKNPFSDVPDEPGYPRNAILWAYSEGIVAGNADGTYGVGQAIQRQAVAGMLYKYAQKYNYDLTVNPEALTGFNDSKKVSNWAGNSMKWAITQGIITGKDDRTLDPLGNATRAECAAMIMRLINKNSGEKPKVGDIIKFGKSEQDANASNGKEPIEWQVLKVESNRVLVISKDVLDNRRYNELNGVMLTWETCDLRYWLNNDFKNEAFNGSELARIPTVTVKNEDNESAGIEGGNDTQDKLFCLSISEIDELFEMNYKPGGYHPNYLLYSQYLIAAPSQYTISQDAYVFHITEEYYNDYLSGWNYNRDVIGKTGTNWWLRTPAQINGQANEFCNCFVEYQGFSGEGMRQQVRQPYGVRPALYYYY